MRKIRQFLPEILLGILLVGAVLVPILVFRGPKPIFRYARIRDESFETVLYELREDNTLRVRTGVSYEVLKLSHDHFLMHTDFDKLFALDEAESTRLVTLLRQVLSLHKPGDSREDDGGEWSESVFYNDRFFIWDAHGNGLADALSEYIAE